MENTYILNRPNTRFGHGAYQVRPCKKHDPDIPVLPVLRSHPTQDGVYFIINVVEHNGCALIVLESLPRINHEPRGRLFCSESAHIDSVNQKAQGVSFFYLGSDAQERIGMMTDPSEPSGT